MSNSVFKITEADYSDSLMLVVAPDGTVKPDRNTVAEYLSTKSKVDINVMRMHKVALGEVDYTMDQLTYINSDDNDEEQTGEMDELSRNLRNIRMDHDYTPFTSPSHRASALDVVEDELAQQLSLLEQGGNLEPRVEEKPASAPTPSSVVPKTIPVITLDPSKMPPLTKITKVVKGKKQTIFIDSKQFAESSAVVQSESLIRNALEVLVSRPPKQKAKMISTGQLKEKPSDDVFKKPPPPPPVRIKEPERSREPETPKKPAEPAPLPKEEKKPQPKETEVSMPSEKEQQQQGDEVVDEEEDEDEEDLEDEEDDDIYDDGLDDEDDDDLQDDDNDSDFEPEEELKLKIAEVKMRMERKKTERRNEKMSSGKRVKVAAKPVDKGEPEPVAVKPPAEPVASTAEKSQVVEKKPTPKKEKRVPKPMPDDLALFSTPDIIRRVAKDTPAPVDKPDKPEKPIPLPPPTIPQTPPSTKQAAAKISPENRSKSLHDLKAKRATETTSTDKDRRSSLDSSTNKSASKEPTPIEPPSNPPAPIEQVSLQEYTDSANTSSENIQDPLEPLPNAEDIRSIIQCENTKSYSSNLIIPDIGQDDHNNLDAAGLDLDLDKSILDNINEDMISDDMLYEVAKSLVNNTELQNAIDKSIEEGKLELNTTIDDTDGPKTVSQSQPVLAPEPPAEANNVKETQKEHKSSPMVQQGGTQIIRPDGRVVVIPPIERPTTRSRNKRKENSTDSPVRLTKPVHKPLDDEHVSGNELDSSADEEEQSEDDPNKLWCICNQPHNNRFMICCDTCEEWYHGKCVNVTKAMGQAMESEGKEWICIYCRDNSLRRPKAAARRIRKASRTSTDSGGGGSGGGCSSSSSNKKGASSSGSSTSTPQKADEEKHMEKQVLNQGGCIVCGKPSRKSSIYCSDTCILKHAKGVKKAVVFNRKSGKILSGNNAPSVSNLDKWLQENPDYEVVRTAAKQLSNKPAKLMQSKLQLVKNTNNAGVSLAVQRKGVNVGILNHAPRSAPTSPTVEKDSKEKEHRRFSSTALKIVSKQNVQEKQSKIKLVPAAPLPPKPSPVTPKQSKLAQSKLSTTPTTSKEKPKDIKDKPQTTPKDKVKPEAKEKQQSQQPPKTPKLRQLEIPAQPKQENLRDTVKKTFFEQLCTRLKKDADLKLTDDEVKTISNEIESQLYKCFGDTGQKYRNKYRSLIFNIKDVKNQTLWRRICERSVNPYQLVRLSPDDLASQELAQWRERESKHQLDMIKKTELELLNCNRQFVVKTHKGEQVFEDNRPNNQVTEVISELGADSTSTEKGDIEKDKEFDKEHSDRKSSKHSKRDRSRARDRSRDRSHRERKDSKESRKPSKDHKKDRDRSRYSDKRRSRSRSRDRRKHSSSHKSSRHKRDISTDKLDKKSKEILEQLVDKQIVPPLEDRLWKHVAQEDIPVPPPAESDSDNEPSSTVTIPTPPRVSESDDADKDNPDLEDSDDLDIDAKSPPPLDHILAESLWKGSINMIDVAQISITVHEVSGDCNGLGDEMPLSNLDIVGRIAPDTVWEYIRKMKSSNSKSISVVRLNAVNVEERMPYLALYSYLSSRKRLGVVKSVNKAIKDFYVLPLASHTPIPDPLLPLSGPGFEDSRPALLIGVVVRDKRKRPLEMPTPSQSATKRIRVDIVAKSPVSGSSTPPSSTRSYTPPPSRDPRIKPALPPPLPPLPPPPATQPPPQSSPEPDIEDDMDEPYSPEDSDPDTPDETLTNRLNTSEASSFLDTSVKSGTFEPFSNKFCGIPGLDGDPANISDTVDLEKKMAELDQRIAAQKAEIDKVSQDIVSSGDIQAASLANIALPNDLHQILASIKTIGVAGDGTDVPPKPAAESGNLTIPLMLPKLTSRPLTGVASTIPLNLPTRPKTKPEEKSSVLSSLSADDLIKKAAEMLGQPVGKKPRID